MSHDDNVDEASSEEGAGAGRRHDAGTSEKAADSDAATNDFGEGSGEKRGAEDTNSSELDREASRELTHVEEILDGELDEPRVEEIIAQERWEGPLPPPAALAAYERVLPGAADRAFRLAERNLELRFERQATVRVAVDGQVGIEKITAEADRDALKRGQYLAASISGLIGTLSFAGLFLTPWAAVGFSVPLAQVATALIRTVSDKSSKSDHEQAISDEQDEDDD